MKEKTNILSIAIILSLFSIILRLNCLGWMGLFALISIIVIGIIHFIFLIQIDRYLNTENRNNAWIGVLIFPLIFLFQFDFGDSGPTLYMYDLILGETSFPLKNKTYWIAIFSTIVYIVNFYKWSKKVKKISKVKRKFKLSDYL